MTSLYTISEPDGTQWGCWAALDAGAALDMLDEAARHDPDLYPGYSSMARFIVAEDSPEGTALPVTH